MFLTRKFSIPLCETTDNTPNYCVKGPLVHLLLCLRTSDTPINISKTAVKSSRRFIWVYTCMYIYASTCIYVYMYYSAYMYYYVHVSVCIICAYIYVLLYICIYIYIYIYTTMNFDDSINK